VPFVVGLALVLVIALVSVALGRVGGDPVAVPGLIGRSEAAAMSAAKSAGVDAQVVERRSAEDPKGTVIAQSPSAGSWFHGNGTVRLVVSSGPARVQVADVVGRPVLNANDQLLADGFVVVLRAVDDPRPEVKGEVLRQDPPGRTMAEPESKVTLTYSNGPPPVPVPDVHGMTPDEAALQLQAVHLNAVPGPTQFSDTVPKGKVIGTEPAQGVKAKYGSDVAVIVSKGQDLVQVPDVRGLDVDTAQSRLESRGFVVDVKNFRKGHRVKSQNPSAGEKVRRGITVTLRLG
jgi:serine/threonine-protein kinase